MGGIKLRKLTAAATIGDKTRRGEGRRAEKRNGEEDVRESYFALALRVI
jgi:hypothetical protein